MQRKPKTSPLAHLAKRCQELDRAWNSPVVGYKRRSGMGVRGVFSGKVRKPGRARPRALLSHLSSRASTPRSASAPCKLLARHATNPGSEEVSPVPNPRFPGRWLGAASPAPPRPPTSRDAGVSGSPLPGTPGCCPAATSNHFRKGTSLATESPASTKSQ